jgi:hypothetical protein
MANNSTNSSDHESVIIDDGEAMAVSNNNQMIIADNNRIVVSNDRTITPLVEKYGTYTVVKRSHTGRLRTVFLP